MRVRILLVAAGLFAGADVLFAQSWRKALDRGDYEKASHLLHDAVLHRPAGVEDPDPIATEHLGLLYAHGLGVRADPVLACSILRWASFVAHDDDPTRQRLSAAATSHCGTLTYEDRTEAGNLTGCVVFDVPAETFHLGAGHAVEITRTGLRVIHGVSIVEEEVSVFGCHRQVSLVRYRPVLTPSRTGGLAMRHFVEFFAWTSVSEGRPLRALTWVLVEVAGASVLPRAQEVVAQTTSAVWPPGHPAVALPATVLTAAWDGSVAWHVATRPGKSGVVEPLAGAR